MPSDQTYENHRHTPGPTVLAASFSLAALISFVVSWLGHRGTGLGLLFLTAAVMVLVVIGRGYTVALQDRIIRLEMRLRLQAVLPASQQGAFDRLTKRQIIGLRFASDAELPALVDRAIGESLTEDQIKRAITNWVGDYQRT